MNCKSVCAPVRLFKKKCNYIPLSQIPCFAHISISSCRGSSLPVTHNYWFRPTGWSCLITFWEMWGNYCLSCGDRIILNENMMWEDSFHQYAWEGMYIIEISLNFCSASWFLNECRHIFSMPKESPRSEACQQLTVKVSRMQFEKLSAANIHSVKYFKGGLQSPWHTMKSNAYPAPHQCCFMHSVRMFASLWHPGVSGQKTSHSPWVYQSGCCTKTFFSFEN